MRRSFAPLLSLLAAAAPALSRAEGQAEKAGQATGVLTRAPTVISPVEPEYPAEAKAAGLTGEVTLEIKISENGEVKDAVVSRSAGHGFDEAALEASKRMRFSPAEIDGKPSAVRIEYRFTFTLKAEPRPEEAEPEVSPSAPPPNLRGRVLEMGTRLPVAAALVRAGDRSTYTDKDGRFELAIQAGAVKVTVKDLGHETFEVKEELPVGKVTEVTYWLLPNGRPSNETVVTSTREVHEVTQTAITAGEMNRIAGVNGDTVKVVQNLPGVARAPFGLGQLVIRGGNPRDTQVYVDDLPVPEVFHFGGLTSIYSSELLKEVEFEPGNFGVENGRAIGGRVNLVTRDPGERTHLVGDVNLYQATALYEGRLSEDVGFAVAARRSYADAIIRAALSHRSNGPGVSVAPQFYDLQAKLAWKASKDDTVRFDVFGSSDRLVLTDVNTRGLVNLNALEYGNQFYKANLRWDRRISDDTRLHFALGGGFQEFVGQAGQYYTETDDIWSTTFRAELRHRVIPGFSLTAGTDGEWFPTARVKVTSGSLDVPGQITSSTNVFTSPVRFQTTQEGHEAGVFLEGLIEPGLGLHIVPGVRADVHHSLETLTWVDPRLTARLDLDEKTVLKGGVGLYHQAPPLAYMTEQWGNPNLSPEADWQYSLGVERKLPLRVFLDAEVYYKDLFHQAIPTSDVVMRNGQSVPEHFTSIGSGKAYGAELLLRVDPGGRFSGWIAYSLSRSFLDQSVTNGQIQRGESPYDQPNNLVALGTVELPEVWNGLSAGFRLRYTTGNPYLRIHSAVYDADGDVYHPTTAGAYNARMPDFFQLDLRVDKKWTYKLWTLSVYLEVENATNHVNPDFPAYNFDYSKQGFISDLGFFPAFGVRAEY